MVQRPNILWIFCDELRFDALSCHGNPWAPVSTPNIDRIAAAGVRFERFYVDSPVCVSSRYAQLTGATPGRTGVYHNDAMNLTEAIEPVVPFVNAFVDAGYTVADFGKAHVPFGLEAFPWNEAEGSDMMREVNDFDDRVVAPYGGTLAATWPADVAYRPERLTDNVTRFLREQVDGQPFFCRASYLQPHTPVAVPQPWSGRYDGHDWPVAIEQPPHLSAFEARYGAECGMATMTDEQVFAARSRYHGLVSWLDDQVGRLLDTLETSGLAGNTTVVFGADHGAFLGELGGAMGKQLFSPPAHQVPFIVSRPGHLDDGAVDTTIAAGVDVAPTMLGLAGLDPVAEADGRDVFTDPAPDEVFSMIGYGHTDARAFSLVGWGSYVDERGWPQRACIRTDRHRLDRNVRIDGAPVTDDDSDVFLADSHADPDEVVNRAGDTETAEIRVDLEQRLDAHLADAVVVTDEQVAEARAALLTMIVERRELQAMEGDQ
ncbi:MAG: sulfatase family protein [Acidimicrobiales bacterium]